MDEIFDRVKNLIRRFGNNRRRALLAVITLEIIGILILSFLLRKPLTQKFLATAPKAYSILVMNNQSRYVVSNNDFLTGKTIPNTKVVTLITPSKIKNAVTADNQGNWSYGIPADLEYGRYQFSVGYFDNSNKLVFFKTYKIRVTSNNKLESWFNKFFFIGKARAQSASEEILIESPLQQVTASEETPRESSTQTCQTTYCIGILELGANSSTLLPSSALLPTVLVLDKNGNFVTQDQNMNLDLILESPDGNIVVLNEPRQCSGIKPCLRRLPQTLPLGDYNLRANLKVNNEEILSEPVSIKVGYSQLLVDPLLDASDPSYSNGPCYGDVCPVQRGAKVVPLKNIYTANPQFERGTPMNMVADCKTDSCLIPQSFINSRYSQGSLNIISSFIEDKNQELISCIEGSKSHPSSSTSLAATLATLSEALGQTNLLGLQGTYILNQLISTDSITCFIGHEKEQNLSMFGETDLTFENIELKTNASFEDLTDYYYQTGIPIIVGMNFNQTDPHYATIAAITDNYVWVVDPLDPKEENFALRFDKQIFINDYFNGNYFAIAPK